MLLHVDGRRRRLVGYRGHHNGACNATGLRLWHNVHLANRDVAVQNGRLPAGQLGQGVRLNQDGVRPRDTGGQLGGLPGPTRSYDCGRRGDLRRDGHGGWAAAYWPDLGFPYAHEVLHRGCFARVHVDDDGLEFLLLVGCGGHGCLLHDRVVEDFDFFGWKGLE